KNVIINAPPEVAITADISGCVGDQLEFRATSAMDPDGDDLEYYWTFGDGTIKQGASIVTHTYERGGEYRVTVIVDDGKATACSTASAEARIRVNTPPVADAGPNLSCCAGQSAEFNATASSDADDDPLLYVWTFGDGTKLEGSRVNHRYDKSGSYTVELTVEDNSQTHCSTSSATFVAEVNAKPTATFNVR
ncbi:MAG: PKD domain-containing protein, partial [Candidatus Omnitrophica bacterium]|nr:PKD domain-containing protein [Candidatus Omnitrophota bacterium]